LSTSDAAAPALSAVLITSVTEIVGDSTAGISGILLLNASWPEAFLPLSDVFEGTLLIRKDLDQQQLESL
jgi:hypothetical protein